MTVELANKLEKLKGTVAQKMQNNVVVPQSYEPSKEELAESKRLQRVREIAMERKEVSAILNRWLNNAIASGKMSAQADCQRVIAFVNKLSASFEA